MNAVLKVMIMRPIRKKIEYKYPETVVVAEVLADEMICASYGDGSIEDLNVIEENW